MLPERKSVRQGAVIVRNNLALAARRKQSDDTTSNQTLALPSDAALHDGPWFLPEFTHNWLVESYPPSYESHRTLQYLVTLANQTHLQP